MRVRAAGEKPNSWWLAPSPLPPSSVMLISGEMCQMPKCHTPAADGRDAPGLAL
jgi:hypothetical protein